MPHRDCSNVQDENVQDDNQAFNTPFRELNKDDLDDVDWANPNSLWGKPLAMVAVLIASHAAVLLFGVVIGRRLSEAASVCPSGTCSNLTRRFSSGATGMHARLCLA